MNRLIIIIGLVVLSGTSARAANLNNNDNGVSYGQASSLSRSGNTKYLGSNQASQPLGISRHENSKPNSAVSFSGKSHLIIAEIADPDRGTPGGRKSNPSGGNR